MQARRGSRSYATELENLQALCAWRDGNMNSEQAAKFLDVTIEELTDLWRQAVEAGKELAK